MSTFGIFLADRYKLTSNSSVIIKTLLKENSFKKLAISFVLGFSKTGFYIATNLPCLRSSENIDLIAALYIFLLIFLL